METNINLRDARAFCAVVDKGSISAAAIHLNETKGSISRRISRLEQQLGSALIQRVGGRAQATETGLTYRQRLATALEMLDDAASELTQQQSQLSGHLRITAAQGTVDEIQLGRMCAEFINLYPEVHLEVLITDQALSFAQHQIDFTFRVGAGQLPDSNHKSIYLMDMPVGFAASPGYLQRFGEPETPEDLAEHRLLMMRLPGRAVQLKLQPKDGSKPVKNYVLHGQLTSQDNRFLEQAALADGGIILKPAGSSDPYLSSGQLRSILTDWHAVDEFKLFLLFANRPLTATALAFKRFISEQLKK